MRLQAPTCIYRMVGGPMQRDRTLEICDEQYWGGAGNTEEEDIYEEACS